MRPGVGPAPRPLDCTWTDVNIRADVPDAAAIDGFAAGTLVAAEYIQHIESLTLSLAASTSVPFGAHVYRLLYVSVVDGRSTFVSARLAVPDAGAPGPARGVVAHQHGTFGFGDDCAPSALPGFGFESEVNPNAAWALSENFVVVMSDYPGLGTPGPHPYVSRVATGTSVLDGVLAARSFCDDARGVSAAGAVPTLLEGHSQGAHATVAALTLVDQRSEDFDIRAAVALALPAEHGRLMQRMITAGDVEPALVAMGIAGQLHAHGDAFGSFDDWFVKDVSDWFAERGDEACAPELSLRLQRTPAALFRSAVLDAVEQGDFAGLGVSDALDEESLVAVSPHVPLLVLHGENDALIPVDIIADLAAQWTENATLSIEPGEDHWVLPSVARQKTFDFLLDHF